MSFAVVIPTREDRPGFLDHCMMQMDRQTLKPGRIFIIGKKCIEPLPGKPDVTNRIRYGIDLSRQGGYDRCFVIEDDDYYPDQYFAQAPVDDFVGIRETYYYNIFFARYSFFDHGDRAPLCCTGFRISALKDFDWEIADRLFLDVDLWRYARDMDYKFYRPKIMPVGIKHGIGFCGGIGHKKNYPFQKDDRGYGLLEKLIRPESFEFYMSLKNGT